MLSYITDIYFSLCDSFGFLGALTFRKSGSIVYYNSEMYMEAMRWIKKMLSNYNRRIAIKEEEIPRTIFGLKILEHTGIDKDINELVPKRTTETLKMLMSYRTEFDLSNFTNQDLTLTLNSKEAKAMEDKSMLRVYIDLSHNEVNFQAFATRLSVENYCEAKAIDPKIFNKVREELPIYPQFDDEGYCITKFKFNMIDEIEELVKNNTRGFQCMSDSHIITIR